MLTEPILTLAVALAVPIWIAVEEILHRRRRRQAERPAPQRRERPAKLAHAHAAPMHYHDAAISR